MREILFFLQKETNWTQAGLGWLGKVEGMGLDLYTAYGVGWGKDPLSRDLHFPRVAKAEECAPAFYPDVGTQGKGRLRLKKKSAVKIKSGVELFILQ